MYVSHAKRHSRKHFRMCQLKQCALFSILTVCQIKMSLLAENLREFEKDNDDLWFLFACLRAVTFDYKLLYTCLTCQYYFQDLVQLKLLEFAKQGKYISPIIVD